MRNEYDMPVSSDDIPVYAEWQDTDDYPRSEESDTLERTIGFFCNSDLRTYAATRYGIEPAVSVETLENLRLMADIRQTIEDFQRLYNTPPQGFEGEL